MPKALKSLPADAGGAPPAADFDSLYRSQFDFVWRTLRRLGVAQPALDDAAQEVFVVVHRRLAELRPDSSPRAWLFAIAQRVASDQRRWVRRKGHGLPLPELLHSDRHDPLDAAMRHEAGELVLDFLDSIDVDRRAVFILSELEQLAAPEIARSVGANLNTIYSRIASVRKAFASYVAQRCEDAPKEERP